MSERIIADLLFILIALLGAAVLGFILGYFFGKRACAKHHGKPFDADAAKKAFGKKINENDLTIIEGIGEKISSLLKNRGINTWQKLSEASPESIKEIMRTDGGSSYEMHDPGTWPNQARLAAEGQWEELKKLQDHLVGGK
jgi:predicted flap endonuclease-1-like 5' DNA nuclease